MSEVSNQPTMPSSRASPCLYAISVTRAGGHANGANTFSQTLHGRHAEHLTKASQAAVSVDDVLSTMKKSFAAVLLTQTLLGRFRALDSQPNLMLARPSVTPTASFVGEGKPIPFARVAVTGSMMPDAKIATMVGVQNTVAARLNDRELDEYIRRLVLRALVLGEDTRLIGDAAADADAPAGLLHDVVDGWCWQSRHVAGGHTRGGERSRRRRTHRSCVGLLGARRGIPGRLQRNGTPLFPNAGPLGGAIFGIPALVSPAASNRLILIDQARIARWQGELEIAASNIGSRRISRQPDDNPTPPTHTTLTSAFQCDTTVLRFVKYVSWHPIDNDHASFIELDLGGSPA